MAETLLAANAINLKVAISGTCSQFDRFCQIARPKFTTFRSNIDVMLLTERSNGAQKKNKWV
jgi:hypothetical protein